MAKSFSANLNWSKVLKMMDTGLSSLSAFAIEIRKHTSYSAAGTKLLDYFNPSLFVTLANQEDSPSFTDAMNGPDAAGFRRAMEIKIEQLIRMEVFDVVDQEKWMNVVSSVWVF